MYFNVSTGISDLDSLLNPQFFFFAIFSAIYQSFASDLFTSVSYAVYAFHCQYYSFFFGFGGTFKLGKFTLVNLKQLPNDFTLSDASLMVSLH